MNNEDILNENQDFDDTLKNSNKIKLLKVQNLYQMMYFIKNGGYRKTPLHTALGLFVYNTTKSKNTISALNRLGCSISYDDILRIRTRYYVRERC